MVFLHNISKLRLQRAPKELIVIGTGPEDGASQTRVHWYSHGSTPSIAIQSLAEFPYVVQHHCKKNGAISLLTVLTHGTFAGPVLGYGNDDILTRERLLARAGWFKSMRRCFDGNAEVVLGGCLVGTNPWLLADLSEVWGGIRVTGHTALQVLACPTYLGDKVTLKGRRMLSGPTDLQAQFNSHPHGTKVKPNPE